MTKLKFPSAYTILMLLTVLMAILTWAIPAGQYQMETNETLGRMVPVVGTYQTVDANPQGLVDILMAPIQGFYDPISYAARAVDVAHQRESNLNHFLHGKQQQTPEFTTTRKVVLAIFGITFVIMMWGVSIAGWWMAELSALFIGSSIVVGLVARMSEAEITESFVNGARDLLGVALIIAIARGLVVVMDNGNITHTILNYAEGLLGGLHEVAFINAIYWIEAVMCLVVPSSSGLAVLSMPILAPLADFAGVSRELVVTAYQSASGLPNLVTPTSGVVMGGLAIGRVAYPAWLKFIGPLLAILTTMVMILLSLGVMLG